MMRTLIAAAFAACLAGPALADADATIKYRQNAMKAISSQMGSIVAILKGDIDNKAALANHATIMGEATSTAITIPAFKTNTDGQGDLKTTATADVWGEWDKFEEGLKKLEQAGKEMAMAGADATMDNVKALGSACKACHDNFRQK